LGAIGSSEFIQIIPINQSGIMELYLRQIPLLTQPLYRLRVNLETMAGLYHIKIII